MQSPLIDKVTEDLHCCYCKSCIFMLITDLRYIADGNQGKNINKYRGVRSDDIIKWYHYEQICNLHLLIK